MERELWDAVDREGRPLGFDLVRGEPVPEGAYHLVVEIYAVTHDGRVLVTQRHPDKPWGLHWEVTGGSVVKGESPLAGARRELREETGAAAGSFQSLGELYPSPGYCGEVIHMYLARDLDFGDMNLDEDEFLNLERIPFSDLVEQVLSGEVKDAKTIAAVLKAKLLLGL